MSNEIVKFDAPELAAVEPSKAEMIRKTFEPMADMLSEFEEAYAAITKEVSTGITKEITAKAKRLRLNIAKVRIETGKLKDQQKAYILLEGKAIQGVHNILVFAVKEKEDKLKAIEDHFETVERQRLQALQSERVALLSPYVEDADQRNLSGLEEDTWNALLSTKKQQHEDRIAAEKKAQEERIAKEKAEAEERERIRLENEKLKAEAAERDRVAKLEAEKRKKEDAERERLAKIEQDKREKAEKERQEKEAARVAKEIEDREAERIAIEEKNRKEREAIEAKAKQEREEAEAKLKAEREERERLQAEIKAKEEAEAKAKEEEAARIQAEFSKGDEAKVADLVADLEALRTKYEFQSSANKAMYSGVCELLGKVIAYVHK